RSRGEIINFDIRAGVLVVSPEDLAGEPFFEGLLSAFRLESLGTVPGGLGIRPEIFSGRPIAARFAAAGIRNFRRTAHGRPSRPKARTRPEATGGPRAGLSCARFVNGERSSFERLIIELADRLLGLLGIGEF